MFDGEIPASIGEMSNLENLDLSNNNFFGPIPKQFLLGCFSLQVLRMSNNSLQGNIFSAPTNLGSLYVLIADNNKFNGTLEDRFLLRALQVLDISYNNLSGILPSWILKSPLYMLSVSSNNFEGAIPMDLCKNHLMFLDLSYNKLSNAIPPCLFTFFGLEYIFLRGNILTGTLPEISSRFVEVVDVSHNKIFGSILKNFYELAYLEVLLLAGNELEGHLPIQICQMKCINFLDLSHNHFTVSIPSCLDSMSFGNHSFFQEEVSETFNEVYANNFYPHFHLDEGTVYDYSFGRSQVQLVTKSLSYSYEGQVLITMSGLDLSSSQTLEIPYQIGNLQALQYVGDNPVDQSLLEKSLVLLHLCLP